MNAERKIELLKYIAAQIGLSGKEIERSASGFYTGLNSEHEATISTKYAIGALLNAEREAILKEEQRKNGSKSRASAARKFLKHAPDSKLAFHYAKTMEDGTQCICNGWACALLKNHIPLEECPEILPYPVSMSTAERFFERGKRSYELAIPERAELAARLREQPKIAGIRVWDWGDDKFKMNGDYVLEMMQILDDGGKLDAHMEDFRLVLENSSGDRGVVLAIRK